MRMPENVPTLSHDERVAPPSKAVPLDEVTASNEAPAWIARNLVEAGIILGYGYKNPFATMPSNVDAFDTFARDAYNLAQGSQDLMHQLRNGFARGISLTRASELDKSVKRVVEIYKTPPPRLR